MFSPITYKSFVISQKVNAFSTYYLPEPSRSGYTFDGWYKDAALTDKVLATDIVDRNITIYAKWIAEE